VNATIPSQRKQGILVGLAVAATLVGGGFAAKELLTSGASTTALSSYRAQLQNIKQPVPFLGPYAQHHKGYAQCGPGVRLMEGALKHTTPPVRKTKASNCIGTATTRQIVVFQTRHHIRPTGIYGLKTHRALAHAYTRTQVRDLATLAARRLQQLRYVTIHTIAFHAKLLESRMIYCEYGQLRSCGRRGVWPAWPDVPRHTDCSGFVSWVYYQAGLPNPSGSGVGTTHSLILYGRPIALSANLKVGDLIFYGANTHVAIYIGNGLVASHGSFGVKFWPWRYRSVYAIHRYF
jgi:hypothetical protein